MNLKLSVSGPRTSETKFPLWRAKIDVTEIKEPKKNLAVRNLFVKRSPLDNYSPKVLLPGTVVVRGVVKWVRLFPLGKGGDDPCASSAPFDPFDYDGYDPYLFKWEGGAFPPYEVLLVVQAQPEDWVKKTGDSNELKFPCCVCLAGEIFLNRLQPLNNSDQKWQAQFPVAGKAGQLSVHSSGLSFEGEAHMPWEMEKPGIAAPFLAEVPFPSQPGALRLTLDRERMSVEERWTPSLARLGDAFQNLADALHSAGRKRPQWAALELVNLTSLPRFHWDIFPAETGEVKSMLRLERGEINLSISDQEPDGPNAVQRPLLTASPAITFDSPDKFAERLSLSFDEGELSYTFEVGKNEDGTEKEEEAPDEASLAEPLRENLLIPRSLNPRRIVWAPGFVMPTAAQESELSNLVEKKESFSPGFRAAVARLLKELKKTSLFQLTARRIESGEWSEEIKLSNVEAEYDAPSAAILLRHQHELPAPDQSEDAAGPDILWGFATLEDGWAELPFLNVTEQHFVDALPAPLPEVGTPLLAGAAVFGNDATDPLTLGEFRRRGEQPWRVTLMNGSRYAGSWELSREKQTDPWSLQSASVTVFQPELVLNGFLWLGTETPSAADALPSLDDWLASLSMVSLRTPNSSDRFPSPFVLSFQDLIFDKTPLSGGDPPGPTVAYASLRKWSFAYGANEDLVFKRPGLEKPPDEPDHTLFETLLLYGVWQLNTVVNNVWQDIGGNDSPLRKLLEGKRAGFWLHLPLVWRRHPTLPAIQTLPLTQNQLPPIYPSPSRQLAPFELDVRAQDNSSLKLPGDWSFGVATDEGAARWPSLQSHAASARVWRAVKKREDEPGVESSFLRLALLSLPGLVLDPNLAEPVLLQPPDFLNAQLLYGLAYTDELNALAQLPKEGDAAASPERPVVPLRREDYEDYWARLAEKALLARHDADEIIGGSQKHSVVRGLVEPFEWGITATFDAAYPGTLTLVEAADKQRTLKGDSALRGLDGSFKESGGVLRLADSTAESDFTVVSGSMNAAPDGDKTLRDQRGLRRQTTTIVKLKGDTLNPEANPPEQHELYKTPLRFHETKDSAKDYALYSLRRARLMAAGDGTAQWSFWFRDLPVQAGQFIRRGTLSNDRRGVNDPRATSPAFAHLTGYEWRLGDGTTEEDGTPAGHLRLLGFDFFPLALERVAFGADDRIEAVEVTGRLQLPAPNARGQSALGNAVRLTFTVKSGDDKQPLALSYIEAALPDPDPGDPTPDPEPVGGGDWGLGETDFAPSLRWSKISLGDNPPHLVIEDARLEIFYFDVRWLFPATKVEFVPDPNHKTRYVGKYTFAPTQADDDTPVRAIKAELTLTLEATETRPDLNVGFRFLWGGANDLRLQANFQVTLLPKPDAMEKPPAEQGEKPIRVFLQLAGAEQEFKEFEASLETGAMQLRFSKLDGATRFFALPGMRLSDVEPVSGFATMAFAVTEVDDALPELKVSAAFCEAIIPCRWGRHLQQPQLDETSAPDYQLVFGSSAGRLYCGYTLEGTTGVGGVTWQSGLLLNGVVEVKNLVSWPLPDYVVEGQASLTLLFDYNSAMLNDGAKETLASVAAELKANANLRLRVEGHADDPGAPKDNLTISTRRAEAVKKYLVESGHVPADSIQTAAFGATKPAVQSTGVEPKNRRVEMRFLRAAAFTLRAVRPETDPPPALSHIRHTIRVLFNQHAVPRDVLGPHSGNLLFDFAHDAAGKGWQTIAVVEHQLADVLLYSTVGQVPNATVAADRRWTVMQEIRLAAPEKVHEFLQFLNGETETSSPTSDEGKTVVLRQANVGFNREALLKRLVGDKDALKLKETLLVEASAPVWVALEKPSEGGAKTTQPDAFTDLQFLPGATQRAILSMPEDFRMRGDGEPSWLLLTLPFLGRLQDLGKDGADAPINEAGSKLQSDPILYLHRRRLDPAATLSPTVLALASWEDKTTRLVKLSEFDQSYDRLWQRLDPATLEESLIRLQHPSDGSVSAAAATALQSDSAAQANPPSIMAAIPADSPGRLSRPKVLARLFDEYRGALPPETPQSDVSPSEPGAADALVWRRNNLFVLQGVSDLPLGETNGSPYGFISVGAQVYTSGLLSNASGTHRHAAAVLIPANLKAPKPGGDATEVDNPEPVSFAVSPYLGLELEPIDTTQTSTPVITLGELLCLNAARTALVSVATQGWQGADGSDKNLHQWADQTRARLAADSPVAVLRIRTVSKTQTGAARTSYRFMVIPVAVPSLPVRRARALRVSPPRLRFEEGQFGGGSMPTGARAFEIAPPQTRGVQAIYLPKLQQSQWPWGMSALRLSIRYTHGGHTGGLLTPATGVVGALPLKANGEGEQEVKLWWSVASHAVQFALPERSQLLPRNFRAKAIQSLLTSATSVPLPPLAELKLTDGDDLSDKEDPPALKFLLKLLAAWQPVLPPSHIYLIVGARAGAPLLIRSFLLSQSGAPSSDQTGSIHAGGAIPVQHRMPRPIPIPPNGAARLLTFAFNATQPFPHTLEDVLNARLVIKSSNIIWRELSLSPKEEDALNGLSQNAAFGETFRKAIADLLTELHKPHDEPPQNLALQTWASYFRPTENLLPSAHSVDSAFLATDNPIGMQVTLMEPQSGVIGLDGDGDLVFVAESSNGKPLLPKEQGDWIVQLELAAEGRRLDYTPNRKSSDPADRHRFSPVGAAPAPALLRQFMAGLPHGTPVLARMHLEPKDPTLPTGYRQTLSFYLRAAQPDRIPLPLQPIFAQFEDPEYNRHLASQTAHVSATLADVGGAGRRDLTLAADRREYNPTSEMVFILFDSTRPASGANEKPQPEQLAGANFVLRKLKLGGERITFELPAEQKTVELNALRTVNLGELKGSTLLPGDTLLLSVERPLKSDSTKTEVLLEMRLDIVAQPVIPVPEAGYALLRTESQAGAPTSVACVRFAFGPSAARIEISNPDDLKREVVRRRAVFQWVDVKRIERPARFGLQKITHSGSTHQPDFLSP